MTVGTYLKAALSISIFLAAVSPAAASAPTQAQPEYPFDGAIITGDGSGDNIWTKLIFIPGATAVEHTGYFSDDYSNVESRAEDANLGPPPYGYIHGWEYTFFAGNPQVAPANDTLVRGTKYYWTVDETDAMGNTFAGDIWEFAVQGYYAFVPNPPNEATFVETDLLLSWLPGFGVQTHDVYLGTSWEDVNNAVYNPINPPPEYLCSVPEPNILVTGLAHGVKYYWRIDEVSSPGPCPPFCGGVYYKGDVWCFTTEPEWLGTIRMDLWWDIIVPPPIIPPPYPDPDPDETRFLTSFDSGEHLGENYVGQIHGWLHPRKSGDYTFWLSTDDDGELFLSTDESPRNMELIAYVTGHAPPYNWYHRPSQQSTPIPLVAGRKYYIMARWQEGGGGDHCMVAWQGPDQPLAPVNGSSDAIIPGSRLSPFVQFRAHNPDPRDGEASVALPVTLSWEPGDNAAEHNVYIGTNFNDVKNAIYRPAYPPPPEFLAVTTEPNILVTGLDFNTTYYWRVDEIPPQMPPPWPSGLYYKGDVWCFTTEARRIFVDVDANGANDGASWENAYNFLQDALADAGSAAEPLEIWIAEGIYTPDSDSADPNGSGDRTATFQLINGVTIKGGYAGFGEANPDARDIELYETILSGDCLGNDVDVNDPCDLLDEPTRGENSYHVVTGSGTNVTAILDGFTITGGNANGYEPHYFGGGMYNDSGSPTVTNCTFTKNYAYERGGGMCNIDSGPTITNCKFTVNSVLMCGGGMYNFNSSNLTLRNCTFSKNFGGHFGGGMVNMDSNLTLTNCIFSGNRAWYKAGGMDNSYSNLILTNCTFTGNQSDGDGGAMANWEGSLTLTNCILWGDSPDEISTSINTTMIAYSDVQGGWPGDGNIDADPCFVDAASGDLRLSSDSPCIDAGYNNAPNLPPIDMDGHPRIIDGDCNETEVVDMGAFEFNYAYMGDFDYNCRVNFADLSIFGLAWTSQPGDFNWDFACDIGIPADNVINKLDLAAFADNWLAGI